MTVIPINIESSTVIASITSQQKDKMTHRIENHHFLNNKTYLEVEARNKIVVIEAQEDNRFEDITSLNQKLL
jgi:hypothetical protein